MKLSYPQALRFLYGLHLFGTKLDLENTLRLSQLAGNPHLRLRFIHVAGTNGKGSTCAILESIYRAAGLRVGLFTSPHLVSFRERIQVNRELISEAQVIRLADEMQSCVDALLPVRHPTFFEVVTVMALRYFEEQHCDLVIWETGLGGRLDATNIVTPLASVITNIQFDHENWLGSTLPEIAMEKAGIIKPGVPVVTGAEDPAAFEVIRQTAERNGAALTSVGADRTASPPLNQIRLPLLGEHQQRNASLALATVRVLLPQLPVSDKAIEEGLKKVRWLGRLQVAQTRLGQTIVLDGAHNPAAAESLRAALQLHFPGVRPTLVLGILRDKDWPKMCRILAPIAGRIFFAPVHSQRSTDPRELEEVCHRIVPEIQVKSFDSLNEALAAAREDAFIAITGSLLFVGEAEELLQLMPSVPGERGLNEWAASGPKVCP